ncbi:MAG TPA: hypothetical protein DEH25_10150 [Chloroflexi bacterium]|nr:hypothetical protein [Chloroflexota bacterium]HBY08465.1 hypothetical protein [Chloroflexota bacterium]
MKSLFAGAQVLVVDDEVGVTRLCDRFLTRSGFQVQTVNQPLTGIEILKTQKIDLLLADIRMPQMDGFELLKMAREQQPDLAVVIMTGYGTVETAVESLHQGADGMILKPFSGSELVQSVEQALRNRQREREVQRLQALRPLFEITESLFAEKSPALLRTRLMDVVRQHLKCAHVSFYQRDSNKQTWQQISQQGENFDLSSYSLPEGEMISPEVIQNPQIQSEMIAHQLGHFVIMPFDYQFLFASRQLGEADFNESEMETLRILSRQAVAALENAQLYDELQKRILQVEASQQALVQAEKMAAVGRLTASIAHEINNPLHSVRNCLHLAGRQELSDADRQEYLELASEELERLMHTVRQMLDFYRPSALDRKPTDINSLIEKVIKLLDAQFSDYQIVVQREYAPDLPPVVAVANQLQQVFFNLFLNAIEVMPSGGELVITTQSEGDHVSILVADTGPGIALENPDEIFDPFVSSKEKGLGLGLTISYGVVTAHGGSLSLVTEYENGACFKVQLPAYLTR